MKRLAVCAAICLLAVFLSALPIKQVEAVATYSYDAVNLIVTCFGSTASFAGWYAADVAGGWGTIYRYSTTDYWVDYAMCTEFHIGNETTISTFVATALQINLNSATVSIYNGSTFRLGTLSSATYKTVTNGVQIFGNSMISCFAGGTLQLYGATVRSGYVFTEADCLSSRLYGCLFMNCKINVADIDMYTCLLDSSTLSANSGELSGSFNYIYAGGSNIFLEAAYNYDAIIYNAHIFQTTNIVTGVIFDGNITLVNVDSPAWTMSFVDSDGEIYRLYEFALITTENATIELSYYGQNGGTIYNGTDADGVFSTTLTKGFYNSTGDDTIYSYEPYRLRISKSGYQTYEVNFTISERTSWDIQLQTGTDSDESELPIGLAVGGLFAGFIGVMVFAIKKRR